MVSPEPSVDRPDQDKKIKIADDSNDDRSEELRGLETAMSSSTKSCDHKNSLNSPVGGANARDVIWTLFPPSAAGLLPKKSRWIRPLVDGKEAWSLLGVWIFFFSSPLPLLILPKLVYSSCLCELVMAIVS